MSNLLLVAKQAKTVFLRGRPIFLSLSLSLSLSHSLSLYLFYYFHSWNWKNALWIFQLAFGIKTFSPSHPQQAYSWGPCAWPLCIKKINGSHVALPSSSLNRMTRLAGTPVWTITRVHSPIWSSSLIFESEVAGNAMTKKYHIHRAHHVAVWPPRQPYCQRRTRNHNE